MASSFFDFIDMNCNSKDDIQQSDKIIDSTSSSSLATWAKNDSFQSLHEMSMRSRCSSSVSLKDNARGQAKEKAARCLLALDEDLLVLPLLKVSKKIMNDIFFDILL